LCLAQVSVFGRLLAPIIFGAGHPPSESEGYLGELLRTL